MPGTPQGYQEVQAQLKKSGQVTLDANGNGVLTFDTDNARQRWEITQVVVSTNQAATATTVPLVTLALNTSVLTHMSAGNARGASWNGNQETFTGVEDVGPCDFFAVMFSPPQGQSGTPLSGVIASAVITGSKYTRRG
jgi:hypothetical protein